MYTRQNPNLAYIERRMWQQATTPRIGIVKQLLNKLLNELETVSENERVNLEENFNLYEQMKNFEMDIIRQALYLTDNNQRLAAQMLGINYTTLNAKMKRYGIGCKGENLGLSKEV
ncbi:MAG TPA: helix-turn-helix domain-containing protein [Pyrinomonadaceae bacterium]